MDSIMASLAVLCEEEVPTPFSAISGVSLWLVPWDCEMM